MAAGSTGFSESGDGIPIPGLCRCCYCIICDSSPTVGANWTGLITGYTDPVPAAFTSAQQAVIALAPVATVHDNINGVYYSLTPGGVGSSLLRKGVQGARLYDLAIPPFASVPEDATLAPCFDEINSLYPSTSIGSYATCKSSGLTLGYTVREDAITNVFCPGGNAYDLDTNSIGVAVIYECVVVLYASSGFSQERTVYIQHRRVTYIRIPLGSLICPFSETLDLNTNLIGSTYGTSGVTVFTTFPGSSPHFGATNSDLPFTGSLLLVE